MSKKKEDVLEDSSIQDVIEQDESVEAIKEDEGEAVVEEAEEVDSQETVAETEKNPEELLQDEIESLKLQVQSEKEAALRSLAELENFKRRKEQEVQNFKRYANEGLITDLLVVLDSFHLAVAQSDSSQVEGTDAQLHEGVSLILKQLEDVLKKTGVSEIECENKKFDPNFHQAVSQQENKDVEDETVLQVMQKGYVLHERVIRPAMVVVSKA